MYKTKRVEAENDALDREFRMLSEIIPSEDLDIIKYLKHKDFLRDSRS